MRIEPSPARNDEERVLPLINIIFLLLIFFMLAGRLAASDPFAIEPPRSAGAGQAGVGDVVVLLGADGRLALDGAIVEETALQTAIAARLAGGAVQVELKADGRTEAGRVVAVMKALRGAGVERLKLFAVAGGSR